MGYKALRNKPSWKKRLLQKLFGLAVLLGLAGGATLAINEWYPSQTIEEKIVHSVKFDSSVNSGEQEMVRSYIRDRVLDITGSIDVTATVTASPTELSSVTDVYVPVANVYSTRQKLTTNQLVDLEVLIHDSIGSVDQGSLITTLGLTNPVTTMGDEYVAEIGDDQVLFMPVRMLDSDVKLLEFDGSYYLDSFISGALFKELVISGEGASVLAGIDLYDGHDADSVYKVNMSGVTALTRVMMRKLTEVGDPLHFSVGIGDFLADADLTHVSNEVSFKAECTYHNASFCSPPEFIETLKDSGVDLVELTGNHNNDVGAEYNKSTIELYESLGWGVVGGGLNREEAARPFIVDDKGSKIGFLAYNFPDAPTGGAISGPQKAGANPYHEATVKKDIQALRDEVDFIIVNIQYWECYSYPDGYVEFPSCDKPIGKQESVFKYVIDSGADMVVGSSAHQPQTYELYKGKPVYYGLGNLYFDQTSWPGTERGIILSHYLSDGVLLQTKLSPTVYHSELQTRLMTDDETEYFLGRLKAAR